MAPDKLNPCWGGIVYKFKAYLIIVGSQGISTRLSFDVYPFLSSSYPIPYFIFVTYTLHPVFRFILLPTEAGMTSVSTSIAGLARRRIPLVDATPEFLDAAARAKLPLVAVNGATEFVGSYVVKRLLERGYYVRGICRSGIDYAFLEQLPSAMQRLQIVTVKDFHSKDSIARLEVALKGCLGVIHCSPVGVQMKKMVSLKPSSRVMDSVDAIVDASSAQGSTIKRLVFLSTEMSVFDPLDSPTTGNSNGNGNSNNKAGKVLGEEDWYDVSRHDRDASDYIAYAHTVAEMKLWSRSTRPSVPFTVCSLVPTFAIGPVLSPVHISTSHPMRFTHALMAGRIPELPSVPFCPMDVRDISRILVTLLEKTAVCGRLMACPKDITSTEYVKRCKAIYPRYPWPKSGIENRWVPFWDIDTSESRRFLRTFYFLSPCRHGSRYQLNNDRLRESTDEKFRNIDETIRAALDSIVMSACVNDLRIQIADLPTRPQPAIKG